MSTLRTNNLQNPDSSNVNIELTQNGGAVVSGIITASAGIEGNLTGNITGNTILSGSTTIQSGLNVTGGNVGIGTDESYGDTNSSFSSLSLGGNGTKFGLLEINKSDGTAGSWIDCYGTGGNGDLRITTAGTSGKITFWTGGEFTEKVTIASNGSVGIGSDNPPWPLSVTGTVSGGTVNGGAGVFIGVQDSHSVIQMDTATKSNGCVIDMAYSGQDARGRIYYDHTDDFMAFYTTDVTERLRIDSVGRVTKPYQLWIAGTPTNTTGSGVFNSFDTSSFASPVGLAFNTDRITVPIAGVYMIMFNTICDSSSSRQDADIRINGSTIVNTLSENSTAGYHYRSASIAIKLAANDYIQFNSDDWYSATSTVSHWKTASVYLLG